MAVNLTGIFNFLKAVLPMMVWKKIATIVNISSMAAKTRWLISGVHYVASKPGMIGLIKALPRVFAAFKICRNTLCLSHIAIRRNLDVSEDFQQSISRQTLLGRLGTVEKVAETVVFFAIRFRILHDRRQARCEQGVANGLK